jgi:hypothetical protein
MAMALKQNRMRETQKKKANPNFWLPWAAHSPKRSRAKPAAVRLNPRRITM